MVCAYPFLSMFVSHRDPVKDQWERVSSARPPRGLEKSRTDVPFRVLSRARAAQNAWRSRLHKLIRVIDSMLISPGPWRNNIDPCCHKDTDCIRGSNPTDWNYFFLGEDHVFFGGLPQDMVHHTQRAFAEMP